MQQGPKIIQFSGRRISIAPNASHEHLTSFCYRRKCEDGAPTEDSQAVHVGVVHRIDREGELFGLLAHNNELVVLSTDMMF